MYPIILCPAGGKFVVFGAGRVALRKLEGLRYVGGTVTVIAPQVIPLVRDWCRRHGIRIISRPGKITDIKPGLTLVIDATDDRCLHKKLQRRCRDLNIPLNVVDCPEYCSFIVPAVVRRGKMLVAISTSGCTPFLAKTIRQKLEKLFDRDWTRYVDVCGRIRSRMIAAGLSAAKKRAVYRVLAGNIVTTDAAARRLLKRHGLNPAGPGANPDGLV